MQQKLNIGVLFGGKSAEHEISILSAKNIIEGLDLKKYNPVLIGIDQNGKWFLIENKKKLTDAAKLFNDASIQLCVVPGEQKHQLKAIDPNIDIPNIDVVFPIIHGPYGEDGSLQGLLKLVDIPFVGPSVLGSAVGMDKDIMKRILRDGDIEIARYFCFNQANKNLINYSEIEKSLGLPLFIKPANLGSSIGISKVTEASQFEAAVDLAFQYDRKIIIEEGIEGRELECAVLGNHKNIKVSIPGEVCEVDKKHGFYSYKAKYFDEKGAIIQIPAQLTQAEQDKVMTTALKTYLSLCCEGLARVDVFLTPEGEVYVNEINTLPGFTNVSMYPKLWEASGITYQALLDELIELAIDRHHQEKALLTTV